MRHAALAALLFVSAPISSLCQPSAPAARTAQAPGKAAWVSPRTSDGQPDLQGIWLNNSATPLERPKALEGKPFLSEDEVAELRRRAARLFDGSGTSDFAGGDGFYLGLLANPDRYRNPGATGGSETMIDRVFESRTALIVDPPDGRIPPLTPEGRQRLASRPPPTGGGPRLPAGPEDFSPPLRCLTYGVPRLGATNLAGAGPLGYYQIVQAPGYVVIFLEAIHEARIIPLDGRPHLPRGLGQWSGNSRGRWQGQTLVVDTVGFLPSSSFLGSAQDLHLVERFTRVAADVLDYEIVISDPTTWTGPWTVLVHLRRSAEPIYEYACHEGNYDVMRTMLLGARVSERRQE